MNINQQQKNPLGSVARRRVETAVASAYASTDTAVDNSALYQAVCEQLSLDLDSFNERSPVGQSGTKISRAARTVRWAQQTLREIGVIERVARGKWRVTEAGKLRLRRPEPSMVMLGFSTKLGIGLWGDCQSVAAGLKESVSAVITSPPYPSARRAYGQIPESEYVDWITAVLEPVAATLVPGGSLLLVLGNDCFMPGSPARSTYKERLTLALHDRLGLHKLDSITWVNKSKPP